MSDDVFHKTVQQYDDGLGKLEQERARMRTHLQRILPVLDSLERVAAVATGDFQTSINDVRDQLLAALGFVGVALIEAEGVCFDPRFHESVGTKETGETPDGHVAEVLSNGYKIGEDVLRAARVIVTRGKQSHPN